MMTMVKMEGGGRRAVKVTMMVQQMGSMADRTVGLTKNKITVVVTERLVGDVTPARPEGQFFTDRFFPGAIGTCDQWIDIEIEHEKYSYPHHGLHLGSELLDRYYSISAVACAPPPRPAVPRLVAWTVDRSYNCPAVLGCIDLFKTNVLFQDVKMMIHHEQTSICEY